MHDNHSWLAQRLCDINPPIVKVETTVEKQHSDSDHQQALSELQRLIREAQLLEQELTEAGPGIVSVQSVRRSAQIEQLAKTIRGRLKRR